MTDAEPRVVVGHVQSQRPQHGRAAALSSSLAVSVYRLDFMSLQYQKPPPRMMISQNSLLYFPCRAARSSSAGTIAIAHERVYVK